MARNKKLGKVVKGLVCVAGVTFAGMYLAAKKKKPDYTYKNEPAEQNLLYMQRLLLQSKSKILARFCLHRRESDRIKNILNCISLEV